MIQNNKDAAAITDGSDSQAGPASEQELLTCAENPVPGSTSLIRGWGARHNADVIANPEGPGGLLYKTLQKASQNAHWISPNSIAHFLPVFPLCVKRGEIKKIKVFVFWLTNTDKAARHGQSTRPQFSGMRS